MPTVVSNILKKGFFIRKKKAGKPRRGSLALGIGRGCVEREITVPDPPEGPADHTVRMGTRDNAEIIVSLRPGPKAALGGEKISPTACA